MNTMNPETKFRYRRIFIPLNKILLMFQRPVDEYANFFYLQGEPKDIKIVSAYFDAIYCAVCLIITHPTFEEIKIGQEIPIHEQLLTITLRREPGYEHMKL